MAELEEHSLLSFGHGTFQKCQINPVVYQQSSISRSSFDAYDKTSNKEVIIMDQLFLLGIEIIKSNEYKGSTEQFLMLWNKYIESIEFSYSISSNKDEHESIAREISQRDLNSNNKNGEQNVNIHKHLVTDYGSIIIYLVTSVKVSTEHINKPLNLVISLNILQIQGKPFNQRIVMDQCELDLRYLLDLNRFRPTPVPCRNLIIPIVLKPSLESEVTIAEISPLSSIISISILNNHSQHSFHISDIKLHMERIREIDNKQLSNEQDEQASINSYNMMDTCYDNSKLYNQVTGKSIFEVIKLNNQSVDNNINIELKPLECYSYTYKIQIDQDIINNNFESIWEKKLFGYFETIVTIHYNQILLISEDDDHKNNNNSTMESVLSTLFINEIRDPSSCYFDNINCPIPLDIFLNWSIGTNFHANNNNDNNNNNNNNITNGLVLENQDNNNNDNEKSPTSIQVRIESPSICKVNEKYYISVTLYNNNKEMNSLRNIQIFPCGTNNNNNNSIVNSCYVIQDSLLHISNIIHGESATVKFGLLPLKVGLIELADFYVYCSNENLSKRFSFKLLYPIKISVF